MTWVPIDEFKHPFSVWLCRSYYKGTSEARIALAGVEPEAPSKYYLVAVLVSPETGQWVRSKTKHGDLSMLKESEAADNIEFLTSSAYRPLDFTDNLGHDDQGRMLFYEKMLLPKE